LRPRNSFKPHHGISSFQYAESARVPIQIPPLRSPPLETPLFSSRQRDQIAPSNSTTGSSRFNPRPARAVARSKQPFKLHHRSSSFQSVNLYRRRHQQLVPSISTTGSRRFKRLRPNITGRLYCTPSISTTVLPRSFESPSTGPFPGGSLRISIASSSSPFDLHHGSLIVSSSFQDCDNGATFQTHVNLRSPPPELVVSILDVSPTSTANRFPSSSTTGSRRRPRPSISTTGSLVSSSDRRISRSTTHSTFKLHHAFAVPPFDLHHRISSSQAAPRIGSGLISAPFDLHHRIFSFQGQSSLRGAFVPRAFNPHHRSSSFQFLARSLTHSD
jgi:hypothetical protein